jgi:hypothetical protein
MGHLCHADPTPMLQLIQKPTSQELKYHNFMILQASHSAASVIKPMKKNHKDTKRKLKRSNMPVM